MNLKKLSNYYGGPNMFCISVLEAAFIFLIYGFCIEAAADRYLLPYILLMHYDYVCYFNITIIVIFIALVCYKTYTKRIPFPSYYNIFGFVELHIGNKAGKDNPFKFSGLCAKSILQFMEKNEKYMLIDTWIRKPYQMKRFFGEAVEERKFPFVLEGSYFFFQLYYTKEFKFKKNYRYIIHLDKLTTQQKKQLEQCSKKYEEPLSKII